MRFIDEMPELIGVAEATCRRVIICDLITPRTFEGMFCHWQKLDVGVAHLQNVRQQRVGKLKIT